MLECRKQWVGRGFSVAAAILVVLAGCNKGVDEAKTADTPTVRPKDNLGKTIDAVPTGLRKSPKLLPFKEAVILDPAPAGEMRPVNQTHTGKNAVKIFEAIANELWDKVTFTNNDGSRIKYQAIVATELGDIHIDLYGDEAPNHVRSFVCLAKTGYFDGMVFYRSVNRQVVDSTVAYIETGCPLGTGELGAGSIGYWLRPEISEKLRHEEGVLGACLNEDPNSASCRFHILGVANSYMDGQFTIFGRVTKGLDIVRTINKRAVAEFDRLQQPVVIRSVTIQTVPD